MIRPEYTIEERLLIGRKLRHIMKDYITQAELGIQAFGKTKQAGQALIKRILSGDYKALSVKDVEKMLHILKVEYSAFLKMEDPGNGDLKPLIANGDVLPDKFSEVFTGAREYFDMLEKAQKLGDKDLEKIVLDKMVIALNKQSDDYIEQHNLKKEKDQEKA